jgi:DNA-binding transcriptional MerR regulator
MTTLRLGELASKGKVSLETIRYCEREGLMRAPGDVRPRFIKQSQTLGLPLTIKELLPAK